MQFAIAIYVKKIIAIALLFSLVFSFAGCEKKLTSISLGGNLGDYDVSGKAWGGEYKAIDALEGTYEGGIEYVYGTYYSSKSNTPYIVVYRWEANGKDLVYWTDEMAKDYGDGYCSVDESKGFYVALAALKGDYYYKCCYLFADGDDIVEVDYFCATDEVQLGESGTYLYLPKGYSTELNEEYITEYGGYFYGEYDDNYAFPRIDIMERLTDYEEVYYSWSGFYPDGLPFDEEQWNKWLEDGVDEQDSIEIYSSLGVENYRYQLLNIADTVVTCNDGTLMGVEFSDIFLKTSDGSHFNIWVKGTNEKKSCYYITNAFINSLHTK